MRLEEMEEAAEVQEGQAAEIGEEVEGHKERLAELEEAVAELKEAAGGADSEGLQEAIREAESAKEATETRVEELRDERDRLLEENAELAERAGEALEKKQGAMERVGHLVDAVRPKRDGADAANPAIARMAGALEADVTRTEEALSDLERARDRLQALEI